MAKNTALKVLVEIGAACYLDEHMVNLNCKRLEADEAWSFGPVSHTEARRLWARDSIAIRIASRRLHACPVRRSPLR